MSKEENQTPLTLEQAGNYLKERRESGESILNSPEGMKPTNVDRRKITFELRAIVKTHIPLGDMRTFMLIRIGGASVSEIAKAYGVNEDIVVKFEKLGMDYIKKCLSKDPSYRAGGQSRIISGPGITNRSSLIV